MSLDAQIAAMFASLKRVRGVSVTYSRAASSAVVTAVIGRTAFDVVDASGSVTRTEVRDYLVATADLKFGSTPVVPQLHDTIQETLGGQTVTFEVFAPPGVDCDSTADPGKTFWRIHTKRIATVS